MVRVCSYPGCFNQMKRKCGITHSVTFHKLPLRDPERLKLWLIALRKDLRTANVDSLRVCSEHFSADDFRTCKGRALLKSTAVPMVSQLRTEPRLLRKIQHLQLHGGHNKGNNPFSVSAGDRGIQLCCHGASGVQERT
ncbi:THAP domain-containing protein 1 B-like isoform X1 [Cyprinodon tularosa]|uniref:THAP domain-containing protein 1 B-like isoform X1 n=1 Tax=Cyprinodon tularosa TaxID=77115 RepID=UPI0018E26C37|nr:THAP domain-containing protein 1 B-like isoform X1 [Cyprinodon tularosa]